MRRYPRVCARVLVVLVGIESLILRLRLRAHVHVLLHQRHPLHLHPSTSHLNQAASKTAHQGDN